MTAKSKYRGHEIEFNEELEIWVYSLDKTPVPDDHLERACGNCKQQRTIEGHDACLGTLPGLMNACCGHGNPKEAYVQFLDGTAIHGEDAVIIQNILKKCRDTEKI